MSLFSNCDPLTLLLRLSALHTVKRCAGHADVPVLLIWLVMVSAGGRRKAAAGPSRSDELMKGFFKW